MSMVVRVIRPALPEDMNSLIKLRREYCQQAYKGFDVLCNLEDDKEFSDIFLNWLADPKMRVALLFLDDVLMAFSAYRLPDIASGEILELQSLPGVVLQDIKALVDTILNEMTNLDATYVEVWVLRDNLRARFYYQQFGFKPVGGSREILVGDAKLPFTRYIYCLKECPPDCI